MMENVSSRRRFKRILMHSCLVVRILKNHTDMLAYIP